MQYDTANRLAREIQASEEYTEYMRLKAIVDQSEPGASLLKEYKRLQLMLQMSAVAGGSLPPDDMQRFSQMSSLLYAGTDTSAYLLAEMRLQRMMADIFKILTDAAGLQMDLPGMA